MDKNSSLEHKYIICTDPYENENNKGTCYTINNKIVKVKQINMRELNFIPEAGYVCLEIPENLKVLHNTKLHLSDKSKKEIANAKIQETPFFKIIAIGEHVERYKVGDEILFDRGTPQQPNAEEVLLGEDNFILLHSSFITGKKRVNE